MRYSSLTSFLSHESLSDMEKARNGSATAKCGKSTEHAENAMKKISHVSY